MAAKNARDERDSGVAGNTSGNGDDAEIQRLISGSGDGSGTADGENERDGASSDGIQRESRDSGSQSESSRDSSGSSDAGSSGSISDSGSSQRKGRRTRSGRRANSGSRSDRGDSERAASEETRDAAESVSGLKTPPKQPKVDIDDDIPTANSEIIGDAFQFVFWGIGQATGLEEWELEDDDAHSIGKNGEKWLKSLGKKRAQNILKGLNKIGPSLAFFGSIGMALVPRVRLTVRHAQNGAIRPIQTRKVNGANGNSANSAETRSAGNAGSTDNNSSSGQHERPFRAADFGEVTQGHSFQDIGLPVS